MGVLRDGDDLAHWQLQCLRHIQSLDYVEIVLFVVNAKVPAPRSGGLTRALKLLGSGLLCWRVFDRLISRRSVATRRSALTGDLRNVAELRCAPLPVGKFRETLSDEDLARIADHDLDVVVRFGFGILTGKALELGRYGIWSYHHGDPDHFRGAPPGFWEIHEKAPITGVILQRLTEKLDGGVILERGWFRTISASYSRQLDHLLTSSAPMLGRALARLRHDTTIAQVAASTPLSGPIFRYPKNAAVLRCALQISRAWVSEQLVSLFRHQQWTVGILETSSATIAAAAEDTDLILDDVRWLPEPEGSFLADPFLIAADGQTTVVAEEYVWKSGKGHLSSVADVDGAHVRPILKTSSHLSYPFLFEANGRQLCLPENSESGTTTIYTVGPTGELDALWTLQLNFPAVDATLIKRDGRWWLFCTQAGVNDNDTLYAFYSNDLNSQWIGHELNPIKIDVRSSRPAGSFIEQGQVLIRPAQDCSHVYGGAIVLNEVIALSPSEYEERSIGRVVPDPNGPYPYALHTIASNSNRTVIDGARRTFIFPQMRRALRRKFKNPKQ